MTYQQLKWFILLIPTITVGLWEYVRHEYLLPYISMDLGNWLTPLIVLFVTFTLLTRFFSKLERMQEELKIERAQKAVLEERERIARDLHDGMAQSLFLLSIKVNQLEQLEVAKKDEELLVKLKNDIEHIHDYVRSGIKNLRLPPTINELSWLESVNKYIDVFKQETGLTLKKQIDVNERLLSAEEKFELTACMRETLINIRKHAKARTVWFELYIQSDRKYLQIKDDGQGFSHNNTFQNGHYGIQMMQESCIRMNWQMEITRNANQTIVLFSPR